MTFRTFYIDNKATYALDELVAPIAKPFQSDKTGSVLEGGEVIVHSPCWCMSDLPYCDESPHDFFQLLVMFVCKGSQA